MTEVVPLRLIRQAHTAFDARFYERSARFWPIARAASVFADAPDWPEVSTYERAFDGLEAVRFETRPPRRRGDAFDRRELYDAVIVREGVVPTRPRMWHDFLNALVWATFPRAKRALHRRQHRAIEAWIPPDATRLPNARTRELDALALVDEGGLLVVSDRVSSCEMIFGHALYEGLVIDNRAMVARVVELAVDALPPGESARVACADAALAALLEDAAQLRTPNTLARSLEPLASG